MKRKVLLFSIAFASCMTGLYAENGIDKDKESNRTEKTTGKNDVFFIKKNDKL